MFNAFDAAITPESPVLMVGGDCPVITASLLEKAARALTTHDAVIIPVEDGGYVSLGLKSADRQLFQQVDWSTDRVFEQTVNRLNQLDLDWHRMPTLWDIDTFEDYARWRGL